MTAYNRQQKVKFSANSFPILPEENKFYTALSSRKISLKRSAPSILQINVGKLCNLTCKHCHVEAGPKRTEIMQEETWRACLFAAKELEIKTIDLTGGAPEMVPGFRDLLKESSKIADEVIIRSNLTILVEEGYQDLPELFAKTKAKVVASLPCYSQENVDEQRGEGVFEASIEAIRTLNELGYGSSLQLDLVYNPLGANLPPPQKSLEQSYKELLQDNFGVQFSNLLTITNMPIGRFYSFLKKNKQADSYIELLEESFNPSTVPQLMCRNTINISWDGWIYDCDFNQMLELPIKNREQPIHITELDKLKSLSDYRIATGTHCLGCTAGSGSSCGGSLT